MKISLHYWKTDKKVLKLTFLFRPLKKVLVITGTKFGIQSPHQGKRPPPPFSPAKKVEQC